MDNQLIFWYPYMRARGKALILTTHKHVLVAFGLLVLCACVGPDMWSKRWRSEEHTSELQSRFDLVCRLLLEKKKQNNMTVQAEAVVNHAGWTDARDVVWSD